MVNKYYSDLGMWNRRYKHEILFLLLSLCWWSSGHFSLVCVIAKFFIFYSLQEQLCAHASCAGAWHCSHPPWWVWPVGSIDFLPVCCSGLWWTWDLQPSVMCRNKWMGVCCWFISTVQSKLTLSPSCSLWWICLLTIIWKTCSCRHLHKRFSLGLSFSLSPYLCLFLTFCSLCGICFSWLNNRKW